MPWKTTRRRCLHNGSKVKLPSGHPLPEPVQKMTVKVNEHPPDEGGVISGLRNSFDVSDLAASLPVIGGKSDCSDFSFDSCISDLKVDEESDVSSETSTLGQSAASFISWMDEAELEKSKEVQRLVDQIDDAIYDALPFPVTDQKSLDVLHQIKSSQLHFRVVGQQLLNLPSGTSTSDEDPGEVLASHGVYEEPEMSPPESALLPREVSFETVEMKQDLEELSFHQQDIDSDKRFREKVKTYVMDQLAMYVLSEAAKPFRVVRDKNISSLSEDEELIIQDFPSLRPNTREDVEDVEEEAQEGRNIFQRLNRVQWTESAKSRFTDSLHVSPMTIHPLPRRSALHLRYSNPNFNLVVRDKNRNVGPPQISVISLPQCNNTVEKSVHTRAYHSAAAAKKPGLLDRRFSITAGHERFLEPLVESHSQQTSAPSSPAKWLRRHTLPPINPNENVKNIHRNSSPLSSKLLQCSENKVSFLPLKVPVLGTGLTRLQLAKQLLEQADHRVLWNSGEVFASVEDTKNAKDKRKLWGRKKR